MINIICKGFANIPDEAHTCPVCGKFERHYNLDRLRYANPVQNQMCAPEDFDFAQQYPTFTCYECHTVWQYIGEETECPTK